MQAKSRKSKLKRSRGELEETQEGRREGSGGGHRDIFTV